MFMVLLGHCKLMAQRSFANMLEFDGGLESHQANLLDIHWFESHWGEEAFRGVMEEGIQMFLFRQENQETK